MFSFCVMSCRSDAFENPVIQQHYRNLEALALDMVAPEDTEDLISKMQTNKHLEMLVPLVAGTTTSFLLSHTFCTCLSLFFPTSVPKVDQIDRRLGPLVEDFKDLVYPAGYNPESKPAAKRKTGQSWSHARN